MRYSKTGLELTEHFEATAGPALAAYWDALGGAWTIGWGHTGPEVVQGLLWTREQCEEALTNDVNWANNVVNSLVHCSLKQNEHDALVDFVFNVGAGNFAHSTMLKELNSGNTTMAAIEFEKWDQAGGHVIAGLLKRRTAEELMFKSIED